jgi:SAM-dependent methyltransferase
VTLGARRFGQLAGGTAVSLYLPVGLMAGAVIALQICIMRVFAVGSWAHFGSLVVSLAMMGFGLASAVMCVATAWFERHADRVAGVLLLLFGPLVAGANLLAQQVPFNAVFLIADPMQKWRLAANFLLYLLPFVAGAGFLGCVFLKAQRIFGRVYFADLTGAGLCGLVLLPAMYVFAPADLLIVPLLLWLAGSALWLLTRAKRGSLIALAGAAALAAGCQFALPRLFDLPTLSVSDYKGVAYVRKFPDSRRVYHQPSPFGDIQIYASSYLHFAPGLSDNAAFNLPNLPKNAYLGLYVDGDGPSGIIGNLPALDTAYFNYLPMVAPYLLKTAPDTFVVQFGGGISTALALRSGARRVTVAEGNPAVLGAFRDPAVRDFTGDLLHDARVRVIAYDGRLYLAATAERYDIIDLSLADSTGLSNPGGFAIVEKFAYTEEALQRYMRALKPGGILAVTLWNKEEPPKSVLKLYATMVSAARGLGDGDIARSFFAFGSYLSTATVLYQRGGFSAADIAALRAHTERMSFDNFYYPGLAYDETQTDPLLAAYRDQLFSSAAATPDTTADPTGEPLPEAAAGAMLPATAMGRLVWHYLIDGGWRDIAPRYVFDTRPLTNDRPYFAAYVRPEDLPRVVDRLDLLQDEWGYLLLWATLAIAACAALALVALPVGFGWRTLFGRTPGKLATMVYFACLGLGYIMTEIGLLSDFVLALGNATLAGAVVITGMLVFSGVGSLLSERVLPHARRAMPVIFGATGLMLIGYGLGIDRALDWLGALPYAWRVPCCLLLVMPPALLMGFPMATAMTSLARLGKDHMFLWAWGINGCFSVVGAALVPLVATSFGLAAVLAIGGAAYLVAIPAFFGVLLPLAPPAPARQPA